MFDEVHLRNIVERNDEVRWNIERDCVVALNRRCRWNFFTDNIVENMSNDKKNRSNH
jgi:hypothetical protein